MKATKIKWKRDERPPQQGHRSPETIQRSTATSSLELCQKNKLHSSTDSHLLKMALVQHAKRLFEQCQKNQLHI